MKIRDKKHLHNLCLGFIHSLVILIPFGMALFTAAYALFNKNAYQNYSGKSENVATYITKNSDFEVGQNYYFNVKNYTDLVGLSIGSSQRIYVSNIDNVYTNLNVETVKQIRSIGFYKESNTNFFYIYAYDENGSILFNGVGTNNNNLAFTFDFVSSTLSNSIYTYSHIFYEINTNYNGYLDNAFEYGFQKTNDSFNQIDYSILDFDALELFNIDYANNTYLAFINNYIKYLLNMELVLFIPEILLIFFTLVRRLMLSIVDKTDERSY